MNKIEIEQCNKRLGELGKFANEKKEFTENEIIDWISECVNIFSEIKINQVIMDDFLRFFSFNTEKIEIKDPSFHNIVMPSGENDNFVEVKNFGPFQEIIDFSKDTWLGSPEVVHSLYSIQGSFYYVKIAFSAARNILKKAEEDNRLVPQWIIDSFSMNKNLTNMVSSLDMMENKYQEKNSDGLIINSITLLDSVLNLDNDLKAKGKIGGKLNSLKDDKVKLNKFGVSKDLILSLNNSRLIRNEQMVHKDLPLKYNIPFIIATSFAYLTLFFIEVVMLNGEIINDND